MERRYKKANEVQFFKRFLSKWEAWGLSHTLEYSFTVLPFDSAIDCCQIGNKNTIRIK